jgi:hypothetical protein
MPASEQLMFAGAVGPKRKGHVLLISPLTFTYREFICATLNELGYDVTWWNERASDSTLYKAALRISPVLTRAVSERIFSERIRELTPREITLVLVIKGEGLTSAICSELRACLPGVPMGYYLWDSRSNVRSAPEISAALDATSTFDPVDAHTYAWYYRPLFSRYGPVTPSPMGARDFDWCFVGTLHSDRHRVLSQLRKSGKPGSRSYVFGFCPSSAVLKLRYLTDWSLWRSESTISTTPLSAEAVSSIIARSRVVVDVEHPRQRGLTMRTIETLVSGSKLATTNASIVESDLFHPSRVHILDRRKPYIPEEFINAPFSAFDPGVLERYSASTWARDLIHFALSGSANRPVT